MSPRDAVTAILRVIGQVPTVAITGRPEPVVVGDIAKAIVAILVGAGWVTLDSTAEAGLVTAVGLLVWGVTALWQRWQVTPTVDPRDAAGGQLVPADVGATQPIAPVTPLGQTVSDALTERARQAAPDPPGGRHELREPPR